MKLPDSPKALPLIQLIQGIARPFDYLDAAAKECGDTFTMRSPGFPPTVVFSNPQAIQEILTAEPDRFETGKENKILRPLLGNNSLIQLDGLSHQRQRRLLTPPFHGERMRAYGKIICDVAEQVMKDWTMGNAKPIYPSMQEISLRVILKAVFGPTNLIALN
jgi:cytochrome P450